MSLPRPERGAVLDLCKGRQELKLVPGDQDFELDSGKPLHVRGVSCPGIGEDADAVIVLILGETPPQKPVTWGAREMCNKYDYAILMSNGSQEHKRKIQLLSVPVEGGENIVFYRVEAAEAEFPVIQ